MTEANSVPSGAILRRHWPRTTSFNVNSGVSGPLHTTPSASSCSHTQCVWQNQSRQLPGCWSCSTVIRPSGTSTSTVGLTKANGNATYSASLSSVAVFVQRFPMSIHGRAAYSRTTGVSAGHPSSVRATTSLVPQPGRPPRRAEGGPAGRARGGPPGPVGPEPRAGAAGAPRGAGPGPGGRVDPRAGGAGRGGASDREQPPRQLLLQRGRRAVQEPPFVLPLRD